LAINLVTLSTCNKTADIVMQRSRYCDAT